MTPPRVSVIIVSRDRPEALRLCLLGLSQQAHPAFEIVVVANAASRAGLTGWTDQIKTVAFEDVNISAARNLGIAAAGGDILAFVDDDAVPLPTWLARLTDPIAQGRADGAGGYVLGRNGISLQWGGRMVTPEGQSEPILPQPAGEVVIKGQPDRGAKTEGTNMAFRAEVLRGLGGFDPAFRFYLDETDLNMRLAKAGQSIAIVPGARVIHGFAPSLWRRQDRAPRSLFDIGASLAVYLRKHAPLGATKAAKTREAATQRARLLRHMVAGRLGPEEIGPLLSSFERGWTEGLTRSTGEPLAFQSPTEWQGFQPISPGPVRRIYGFWHNRRDLRTKALSVIASGDRAIVHVFSTTALYHRRCLTCDGYWLQRGGVFGRSVRTDPVFKLWQIERRSMREWTLVAADFETDIGAGVT